MKTSDYKTANIPGMKRLTLYLSAVLVLCFFDLVAIKAQDPVSQNTTTDNQPAITGVIEVEPESEIKLLDWFLLMHGEARLFNMISHIFKAKDDTEKKAIENAR